MVFAYGGSDTGDPERHVTLVHPPDGRRKIMTERGVEDEDSIEKAHWSPGGCYCEWPELSGLAEFRFFCQFVNSTHEVLVHIGGEVTPHAFGYGHLRQHRNQEMGRIVTTSESSHSPSSPAVITKPTI